MRQALKFFFLIMMCGLTACGVQKDTAYYQTHPEDIKYVYDQCIQRDKADQPPTKDCAAAFRAIPIVKIYLTELINSPEQFGMEIMSAQNQMVRLQREYRYALNHYKHYRDIEPVERALRRQQLDIESRYAVIRLVSQMS